MDFEVGRGCFDLKFGKTISLSIAPFCEYFIIFLSNSGWPLIRKVK